MQPLDWNTLNLIGDGGLANSGQPVDSGAHQEMRSHLLCRTEWFANITLPIADVDTAPGSLKSAVDWRKFSSQRKLSLTSIGTRVGLILLFSALHP
jgi:hypothetical protein